MRSDFVDSDEHQVYISYIKQEVSSTEFILQLYVST